jgi:hypothetical protein
MGEVHAVLQAILAEYGAADLVAFMVETVTQVGERQDGENSATIKKKDQSRCVFQQVSPSYRKWRLHLPHQMADTWLSRSHPPTLGL